MRITAGAVQRYIAGLVPDDAKELGRFLREELQKIQDSISAVADGQTDVTHVAPAKPRAGMARYADGTDWNPGSGEGLYDYYDGAWHFRGGSGGGSGTVTSVAATVPSIFSIAGSPITTSGTLAITYSGTALPVANGGTGATSLTAYAPVFGGTTGTGAVQSGTAGATDQVLLSNGASAIATWQTPFAGGLQNKLINGGMRIDQRNEGASWTPTGATLTDYHADCWVYAVKLAATFSFQRVVDAPDGFYHSTKITVAAQHSPLGAGDEYLWGQHIEGHRCVDLAFGTSAAKTVTLNFWVKGSVAGTYAVCLQNSARTRAYIKTYPVTTSWVEQSLTFPGDTGGTWLKTEKTVGLRVLWSLGSNSVDSANNWNTSGVIGVSGNIDLATQTNGSTINITGCELVIGSTKKRPEDQSALDLHLCKRYYQKFLRNIAGYGATNDNPVNLILFPVEMMDTPSLATPTLPTYTNCFGYTVTNPGSQTNKGWNEAITVSSTGAWAATNGVITFASKL